MPLKTLYGPEWITVLPQEGFKINYFCNVYLYTLAFIFYLEINCGKNIPRLTFKNDAIEQSMAPQGRA